MSLSKNLLDGLASSVGTAMIGLAVVPLDLKYPGIEAYGLIDLFAKIILLSNLFSFQKSKKT
jgi:hypothetical protein